MLILILTTSLAVFWWEEQTERTMNHARCLRDDKCWVTRDGLKREVLSAELV
eukprot:gene46342-57789_t